MSDSIPKDWVLGSIADIAEVNPPGSAVTASDNSLVTFLPMAAVEELSGRIDVTAERPFREVKKNFTRFRDNDVLFAKITPSMENGKVAVARDLLGGVGCGTTEFHVIRAATDVAPDYLRLFLVQSRYRHEAKRNMQGAVGQQRVPADFIRESEIPIAPANEQRRIVSKIDELFSRIDEGEAALARVEKLVERYRQSVLKAAVTGELTRDWRAARKRAGEPVESGEALLARILAARRAAWETAELAKMRVKGKPPTDDRWKQKYNEPATPDTTDLPALPKGWVWASIDQIGLVSGGLTKNQRRQTLTAQRPYLRVANVYANRLDMDDVQQIGVEDGELDRVLLQKDDLLVVEGNGSIDQIGRVAVWDGSIAGCVHQNHLIKVRCTELLPSWYALIWCLSPLGRDHIRRVASSTAGLHTLSISKIASLPVPVPTPGELDQIRDRFDQAVALVANERQSLRQSRTTSAALRQSILKAAFSGQLVPQDPHDEPASKLLKRIATERAAAPSLRKRKKKSA